MPIALCPPPSLSLHIHAKQGAPISTGQVLALLRHDSWIFTLTKNVYLRFYCALMLIVQGKHGLQLKAGYSGPFVDFRLMCIWTYPHICARKLLPGGGCSGHCCSNRFYVP